MSTAEKDRAVELLREIVSHAYPDFTRGLVNGYCADGDLIEEAAALLGIEVQK